LFLERFTVQSRLFFFARNPVARLDRYPGTRSLCPGCLAAATPRLVSGAASAVGPPSAADFPRTQPLPPSSSVRRGHESIGVSRTISLRPFCSISSRAGAVDVRRREKPAPWAFPSVACQPRHVRHDLCFEKSRRSASVRPVADRLAYPCHKPVVRDRIEVLFRSASTTGYSLPSAADRLPSTRSLQASPGRTVASSELEFKDRRSMGHLRPFAHDAILASYPSGLVCPPPLDADPFLTGSADSCRSFRSA